MRHYLKYTSRRRPATYHHRIYKSGFHETAPQWWHLRYCSPPGNSCISPPSCLYIKFRSLLLLPQSGVVTVVMDVSLALSSALLSYIFIGYAACCCSFQRFLRCHGERQNQNAAPTMMRATTPTTMPAMAPAGKDDDDLCESALLLVVEEAATGDVTGDATGDATGVQPLPVLSIARMFSSVVGFARHRVNSALS